jgi:hypothetical protein
MSNEFSVYQFLQGEIYEKVREFVSPEEAMKAAIHYTTNVAARLGITEKVMITDGGDCCVWEWKKGEGVVWPKQEKDNGLAANGKDRK